MYIHSLLYFFSAGTFLHQALLVLKIYVTDWNIFLFIAIYFRYTVYFMGRLNPPPSPFFVSPFLFLLFYFYGYLMSMY